MQTLQKFFLALLITFAQTNSVLADYSPFQTRDQNPFNLIQGQPLPVNAQLAVKNQLLWSSNLAITNTLNSQQTGNQSIKLDVESYRINIGLEYGLTNSWAVKINLPLIHKSGGLLDSSINDWHKFFSLPQGNRPTTANNQYQIQRIQNGSIVTRLQSADSGIGDLQLSLANQFYTAPKTRISLWTGLKLPTGSSAKLNGNGAIDASFWLALNHQFGQRWFFNTNTGFVLPAIIVTNSKTANNTGLSRQVLFGHVMLAWQALDGLDIKLQLEGHTSYYPDSGLRLLGSTYITTFGGTVHINQCNDIDIGVSEDVKVTASPDVSFLFSWRYRNGC